MVETKEPWDRFRIKAEVGRRGSTLTEIAEKAGLSGSSCRVALHGSSRAGAEALAKFLGEPLNVLFPGLYLRSRPTHKKPSAKPARSSRQKRGDVTDASRAQA